MLDAFGALASCGDVLVATVGALVVDCAFKVTPMADEFLRMVVIRHICITAGAFCVPATLGAEHGRRKATSVEKQHDLVACFDMFSNRT